MVQLVGTNIELITKSLPKVGEDEWNTCVFSAPDQQKKAVRAVQGSGLRSDDASQYRPLFSRRIPHLNFLTVALNGFRYMPHPMTPSMSVFLRRLLNRRAENWPFSKGGCVL